MLKKLKQLYIKEQFNPKIIGLFINPFYFARKGLYQNISELIGKLHGKLLDIGCGTKPYKEINRIAKVGGLFLMTVPFVWDEHEQPYDYARYSSFGLKHILSENGFEVIEHKKSNNGVEVIFQLINDYIHKVTLTKNIYINLFLNLILMAPVNIIGLALSKILPRNNDLYLDNIVLAKKVRDV